MADFKLGDSTIDAIFIGSDVVDKVYLGADEIWAGGGGSPFTLAMGAGAYSYAGSALGLTVDLQFAMGAGAYSYAGAAVTLTFGTLTLALGPGAYSYDGADLTLGDQHFSSVSFLSGFEGTDGQTTFTDEGPGAHTITRAGDTEVDTAQKKFGLSSAEFDGSGDGLLCDNHADFLFGSGEFTIELFFRMRTNVFTFLVAMYDISGQRSWAVTRQNDSWLRLVLSTDGTSPFNRLSSNTSTALDTWFHLAVDKDSSNKYRLYLDGVMLASSTASETLHAGTGKLSIGGHTSGGSMNGSYMDGWIDELRITKGVARYASDGGFTVPDSAYPRTPNESDPILAMGAGAYAYAGANLGLEADLQFVMGSGAYAYVGADVGLKIEVDFSNVTFLCSWEGADEATSDTDDSDVAATITFLQQSQLDTAITPPFQNSSLLLDGSDRCEMPNIAAYRLGQQDFGMEQFVRFSTLAPSQQCFMSMYQTVGNHRCFAWRFNSAAPEMSFLYSTNGTSAGQAGWNRSWSPSVDTWYHVAVSRKDDEMRMFVDGQILGATETFTFNIFESTSEPLTIGNLGTGNAGVDGWIKETRQVVGQAGRWDNFTPPTGPLPRS